VGLHEDGVDLSETKGFGAVTNGFEQGTEAEVFYGAQGTFRGAYDEGGGVLGEGAVRESDTIQLAVDEALDHTFPDKFLLCGWFFLGCADRCWYEPARSRPTLGRSAAHHGGVDGKKWQSALPL
jgi:hypothetical protein